MQTEVITNTKLTLNHAYCTNAAHILEIIVYIQHGIKPKPRILNKGGYPI